MLGADITIRSSNDRVVTGGKLWGKVAVGTFLGRYAPPHHDRRMNLLVERWRLIVTSAW